MNKLKCNMFGGEDGEALNALMSALFETSGGEDNVYEYISETPKTSLICELYNSLKDLGYKIVKKT